MTPALARAVDDGSIREGYRAAERLTRAHARSFTFASHALFGEARTAAFALYAFCRRADDAVDSADDDTRRAVALGMFRSALEAAFDGDLAPQLNLSWTVTERAAFIHAVRTFRIPAQPFRELLLGVEMDLVKTRYASWEELELYCHRVAGTVGHMMAPVLGCKSGWALEPAAALGKAMQLTNILRDVHEDLQLGRIYLPAAELEAFDVSEEDLRSARVTRGFVELMRFQLHRARTLYARSADGLGALGGFGARATVKLMSAVYADILREIERAGFDVFRRRAKVPFHRKLRLACGALLPGWRAPLPPELPLLHPRRPS